ncbi:MAG: ATP-binding protein [Lachnospiraceae bacterium]|nr:ATP-binding protein [Lachnospiraceae bacterium]
MPLTNSQYDMLLCLYNERQLRNRKEQDRRIANTQQMIPRLSEIDNEVASLSLKKARILFNKNYEQDFDLPAALKELSEERKILLLSHGLPENFLELHYDCSLCQDTGFIHGKKCICFRRAEVALLYSQSNLREVLEKENFRNFSLLYYSEDIVNDDSGLSSRQTAALALKHAEEFVKRFVNSFENLCFYGDTGVGKTFLSHCISKELIERGYSVLYLTAFNLFNLLEQNKFFTNAETREAHHHLFNCDLLIIDDLGTELTNSFVSSQLFLCINERILQKKSTIISTNLSLSKISETYSERTFSRILSHYKMILLFGNDIRIQKQLSGGKNHVADK